MINFEHDTRYWLKFHSGRHVIVIRLQATLETGRHLVLGVHLLKANIRRERHIPCSGYLRQYVVAKLHIRTLHPLGNSSRTTLPKLLIQLNHIIEIGPSKQCAHVESTHLGLGMEVINSGTYAIFHVINNDLTLPRITRIETDPKKHTWGWRDIKPTGERHARRLGLRPFLTTTAHATRRELPSIKPVHDISSKCHLVEGPIDPPAVFTPRGRDDLVFSHGSLRTHKHSRFVELIDQPHWRQQHPAS